MFPIEIPLIQIITIIATARTGSRMLQFFAAMLLTLLSTLALQHNAHVYGEFMMVTAAHRTSGSSKANREYRSTGAALRGPSSHQNIEHDLISLVRHQRKLGTRFQRCGDSAVFCLVSEVCTESGPLSMFTCEQKEETLATANSTVLFPASSPAAVEAPVAVSKYWDDPKANSPTVVVSRAIKLRPVVKIVGEEGMQATYDADGDGDFDLTIVFCVFVLLALIGACCCHETTNNEDA